MSIPDPDVRQISECFIRPPKNNSNLSRLQPIYLTPWDLAMLSINYMQKGLLFSKPPPPPPPLIGLDEDHEIDKEALLLERLKTSLSLALIHFYPLTGQLVTKVDEDQHTSFIFIDCNKGPGAKFTHCALDVTVDDVLSPDNDIVPRFVHTFFDKDGVFNHDGHTKPLLCIQVTDLIDGMFIGCSMNHAVADGISLWHFINSWSEIHHKSAASADGINDNCIPISRPPIHKRWFPDGYGPIIRLPYTHPNQFIIKFEPPITLIEKFFHFSSDSLAKLKVKANSEYSCSTTNSSTPVISTFQAMTALIWKSITRARSLPHDHPTLCKMLSDNRRRLNPPLSQDYFANSIQAPTAATKAGELLQLSLGSVALLLKQAVENHTDETIRDWVRAYIESPFVYKTTTTTTQLEVPCSLILSSSPRFDMYGNEFGLGKPLAVRSGRAGKSDGVVICYPGVQGGGSVDLEICLAPASMKALELDDYFMAFVSF